MKTRTRNAIGAAAAIVAITASVPLSMSASADPAPTAEFPDPQGPGCDAFKAAVPAYKSLHEAQTDKALASIPDISTFNSAISGGFNPAVNIVDMLNNGPYVIFAPTNEAFAKLPPEQLAALKADPAALTKLVLYHEFLGLLGPDTVKGQRPTQEGAEIKVTGDGGDVKINDTAKVVCGGIVAGHARIYTIDTVLDPANAPEPLTPSGTSATSTTNPASATSTSTSTTAVPASNGAAEQHAAG
ncbi:MAG TPA: fasciclin domain-containing protein [Mycobacterium sp.]